ATLRLDLDHRRPIAVALRFRLRREELQYLMYVALLREQARDDAERLVLLQLGPRTPLRVHLGGDVLRAHHQEPGAEWCHGDLEFAVYATGPALEPAWRDGRAAASQVERMQVERQPPEHRVGLR